MQTSLVAPSTSFAVGDRVRYHVAGSPLPPRTGRIVSIEAQGGELYGKCHWESGGSSFVSTGGMKPAPTIASQFAEYRGIEINAALHELCLDELKRAVQKRLSEQSGVRASDLRKWIKDRRIPVNYLQQFADVFEISAQLVRDKIEQMRWELEDAQARAQVKMEAEADEARRVEASGAPKPWEVPISPERMTSYVAAMQSAERI